MTASALAGGCRQARPDPTAGPGSPCHPVCLWAHLEMSPQRPPSQGESLIEGLADAKYFTSAAGPAGKIAGNTGFTHFGLHRGCRLFDPLYAIHDRVASLEQQEKNMRELTCEEISQVDGGILPLLVVAGAYAGGVVIGFSLVAVADSIFG